MRTARTLAGLFYLAIALGWCDVAGAGLIVGVEWHSDRVVGIDPADGTSTIIGYSGYDSLNSLTYAPSGQLLSANRSTTFWIDPETGQPVFSNSSTMIWIDPETGAGTAGATLDIDWSPRGMTFSPEGTLYSVVSHGSSLSNSPDYLHTIDPATGHATQIGLIGDGMLALAFEPGGGLYGWMTTLGLVTIEPLTGTATDVNPSHDGPWMYGLTFAPDGSLYGVSPQSGDIEGLYGIDPQTGVSWLVGSGDYGVEQLRGIAFIPEPGTGLFVMTGMLGFATRRSRAA